MNIHFITSLPVLLNNYLNVGFKFDIINMHGLHHFALEDIHVPLVFQDGKWLMLGIETKF
jgi:hypothetical protein